MVRNLFSYDIKKSDTLIFLPQTGQGWELSSCEKNQKSSYHFFHNRNFFQNNFFDSVDSFKPTSCPHNFFQNRNFLQKNFFFLIRAEDFPRVDGSFTKVHILFET